MDGYLLIDKPSGWTSFDVVNKVRYWLANVTNQPVKKLKVGHAGTLDPNATGLLIVLLGGYTKRQAEFMKLDKVYLATVCLGATSDTDDADGVINDHRVEQKPNLTEVKTVLRGQTGEFKQLPPTYSAIKKSGRKAYELARQGKSVELEPRAVTVRSIDKVKYNWPELTFRANVSSGTYIRSMARDIGQSLGTGGYLKNLRRLSIGEYLLEDAVAISELGPDKLKRHLGQT